MKKISLILAALLGGFVLKCHAMQGTSNHPVFMTGASSAYSITHSTAITITSFTVVNIAPAAGWRTVDMQFMPTNLQDGVTVFYRIDGSTKSIAEYGYMLRLSTPTGASAILPSNGMINTYTEESNAPIYLQVSTGVASVSMRYTFKRKFQ